MDNIQIAKNLVKIAKKEPISDSDAGKPAATISVPSENTSMSYPLTNQVFFIASYNANAENYVKKFGIQGVINPDQSLGGEYKLGSPLYTTEVFMLKCKELGIMPTPEAIQKQLNSDGPKWSVFDAAQDFFETNDFFRQLVSGQKPNLIFSTKLNDLEGFEYQCKRMQNVGYDKNHIHIIWVLPNVREKIDSTEDYWDKTDMLNYEQILYMSMNYLLNRDVDLVGKCFDGDIWVYFDEISLDLGKASMLMNNVCECMKHSGQRPQTRETIKAIWDRIFSRIPKYYYQRDDGTIK